MKKLFLVLALAALGTSASFAQISKGDPTATTIKTGNRPGMGDFGLFFGGGVLVESEEIYLLPVMNFKYFVQDNVEFRAGLDIYHKGKVASGSVKTDGSATQNVSSRNVNGFIHLTPGIAYHFSNTNILDVYVGAELPVGIDRVTATTSTGTTVTKTSSLPLSIGANALVGLQAFIGNLPVALGVEYGLGANLQLGDKTRVEVTNGSNTTRYFTEGARGPQYSSLSARSTSVDHIVRLTLSYYFN